MGVLGSCSSDRRLILWDLTKENDEIYSLNGFHDVFKKILVNSCDIDLPKNIIEKCLLMEEGVNK